MTQSMGYKLVETVHGPMLANLNDIYVGRSLDLYGEYCYAEWAFLEQLVQSGDHVLDVGANYGAHTLGFAKKVGPDGRVWAFEMQNMVFQNLCANLAINGLANVYAYQVGVSDSPGHARIRDINANRVGNFGGVELAKIEDKRAIHKIRLDSIDEICDQADLSLIKIDVEGMELDVLKGAKETVQRCRPYIYAENDRAEKSKDLMQYIMDMDYRIFKHFPPLFNPKNHRGIRENKIGDYISKNIFCMPREDDRPFTGLTEIMCPSEAI